MVGHQGVTGQAHADIPTISRLNDVRFEQFTVRRAGPSNYLIEHLVYTERGGGPAPAGEHSNHILHKIPWQTGRPLCARSRHSVVCWTCPRADAASSPMLLAGWCEKRLLQRYCSGAPAACGRNLLAPLSQCRVSDRSKRSSLGRTRRPRRTDPAADA